MTCIGQMCFEIRLLLRWQFFLSEFNQFNHSDGYTPFGEWDAREIVAKNGEGYFLDAF